MTNKFKNNKKGSVNIWAYWPAFVALVIFICIGIFCQDWLAKIVDKALYGMYPNAIEIAIEINAKSLYNLGFAWYIIFKEEHHQQSGNLTRLFSYFSVAAYPVCETG